MSDLLLLALLIGLASSSISFTVTVTSIFSWLREWVSDLGAKAEEFIHCPYCFNMWVVFISYWVIRAESLLEFILVSFCAQAIAGLIHYVLLRAYKPVAEAELARELEKLNQS